MKLSIPVLILWVALAGTLAWALQNPHMALSPAALIPPHSHLERDCLACHTLGKGAPSDRCVACHAVDKIGVVTTKGESIAKPSVKASFHQRLKQTDCRACHSEHPGSRGNLAHRGFTHAMLAPADRDDCASCHSKPDDALHRGFESACGSCHTSEAWKPATFDHQKYFPLDRDHNATCVTCHPGNVFTRYTCYGCHEHSVARMQAKHSEEGIRDLDNCIRCHKTPSEHGEGGEHGERGEHGEGGEGRRRGGEHGGGDDD